MSTIKVGTISNSSGSASTSADNVINGSAKAWVNFNGTGTVAIRGQYNVSSVTDDGVGLYTINFTTALPDANYAVTNMGALTTTISTSTGQFQGGAADFTTTSFKVRTANASTTADIAMVSYAVFR